MCLARETGKTEAEGAGVPPVPPLSPWRDILGGETVMHGDYLSYLLGLEDSFLGAIFHLTSSDGLNMIIGIFFIAIGLSGFSILVRTLVANPGEINALKAQVSDLKKKFNKYQKEGKTMETARVQKEMMQVQGAIMKKSFAPSIYTMLPYIIVFTWLRNYGYLKNYIALQGYLIKMPFTLPLGGHVLGWFGWYILCSITVSSLIQRLIVPSPK
jgi:uncharacterized membrane protein (DUF106 family)